MKALLLALIVLSPLVIPSCAALDPIPGIETNCTNSTHLTEIINWRNGTGSVTISMLSYARCKFGCDQSRDICYKYPYGALPGEYYLVMEIMALLLLMIVLYRLDVSADDTKLFDVVSPVICVILFATLALQGNNVISSGGDDMNLIMFVWLDYGLAMFSLVPFFFSLFKFIRGVVDYGESA